MIDELLKAWGSSDWSDIARSLGYPSTSPSFRMLGEPEAGPEPFELSQHEIQQVLDAVQWLADTYPAEFAAIGRTYRPWVHGARQPGDGHLVEIATTRLARRLGLSAL